MANLLLSAGIGLLVAWAVVLGAVEFLGMEPVPWHDTLLVAGLGALAAGALAWLLGRSRLARGRQRCVYCNKKVRPGQIYCDEHFRRGLQRVSDQAKARSKHP